MTSLAVVLTARYGSERFPGKVMASVGGEPLLAHIIKRLLSFRGDPEFKVILATTNQIEDRVLVAVAESLGVPVHLGSSRDVVSRMDGAVKQHCPGATHVLRALGDCPFLEQRFIRRALNVMGEYNAEAFLWYLLPDVWPVYGAREFPVAREGWDRIVASAADEEREHVDLYFHRHREAFNIIYHERPEMTYFRPYRLEVDYIEDLAVIRRIGAAVGMGASLDSVIKYLDKNRDVVDLNRGKVEQTGPLTSYEYRLRRKWQALMRGAPIVGWDGRRWEAPSDNASPVFCDAGVCLVGHSKAGVLYTREGQFSGAARVRCECGTGRTWRE